VNAVVELNRSAVGRFSDLAIDVGHTF